jgi:hypothetical protein
MNIRVTRLANGPIIGSHLHPSIGVNIQGPSLIRVPDWIEHRLGAYYLYSLITRVATSASPMRITSRVRGACTLPAACTWRSRAS